MSDSPRPVQRKRKRDSTLQAVDLLNSLMDNKQNTPSRANRPGPATPYPTRRSTYSGGGDSADGVDEFGPVPQTVPSKPNHAHEIEVVTPRRSLKFSEPVPGGSTQYESDRTVQPPGSPESGDKSDDQSAESGDKQSPEKAEDGSGDDTPVISLNTSTKTPVEDSLGSDAAHDDERDEISSKSDEEMLNGEDLASEVELFSNNDEDPQPPISRPSSSPSSSQETPGRKSEAQTVSDIASGPIPTESNEDTSADQGKDAVAQPAGRRDSSRSDASSTKRLPTIAVEITTTKPSSPRSLSTGDHKVDGLSRAGNKQIPDSTTRSTQDEDPPYQPSEASSSSVPSPEPTSSENDVSHHSTEASPQIPDHLRQSMTRKHSTTSSQGTARDKEMPPGRQPSGARQQASSRVVRQGPTEGSQRSHNANHRGGRQATESTSQGRPAISQGATIRPATPDEPTQANPDERRHGPERLEDSTWFKEASELDGQGSNWRRLIQSMRPRKTASDNETAEVGFESLKRDLDFLIHVQTDIIENLALDTGPSAYDLRNYGATLDRIDKQGRRRLEEAYTLSTQGKKEQGGALVEVFDVQIISLLVRLVLVCFQAYHVDHRLFPEASRHLQHAMKVLLQRCDQINALLRGRYVACRAVSPGLRLPLRRLLESLDKGRLKKRHAREDAAPATPAAREDQSKPPKATNQERPWTDEERSALEEGLQLYQGADRYYQICQFYRDGIGQRGMKEVRKESAKLYYRRLPKIREEVKAEEGRRKWWWLLKVVQVE
ncbi:hypothetical protein AbraIFM66951_009098 [Aspergillus brasiliensis]|uniref:Uncharacterized protein n=1 Tax=Aspergillus brasiliensis TaxID=319629 RepID=A0A9W5YWU6_9EURO|nr:hypothetical protein AbraCBS73388_010571 [Aspergillus brasiliensis]GKZ46191.1 hypothetical protein AbraIFM66951_009098 [Aspergillus brasiliensis]